MPGDLRLKGVHRLGVGVDRLALLAKVHVALADALIQRGRVAPGFDGALEGPGRGLVLRRAGTGRGRP